MKPQRTPGSAAALLVATLVLSLALAACDDGSAEEGAATSSPVPAAASPVEATRTQSSEATELQPEATAPSAAGGPVTIGVAAPDFTLTSLAGEDVSLSDYRGRPVLINFWASWCPPCREEFPALGTARETHAADGFEILGVTHDDGEEYAQAFVDDSGAGWPILLDPDDVAWDAYGAIGLPSSYLVDGEGVVQRIHFGPLNEAQLEDHLAAVRSSG